MGSGKTACMVREMVLNKDMKTTYCNIKMKKKTNTIQINRDMIFAKKLEGKKEKMIFNAEFWKDVKNNNPDGINVVIDEAHTLIESRRAMSNTNVIMNDFMALLRRILGDTGDYGELVLITQLGRRLDVNARELATSIHYHLCWYNKVCVKCGFNYWENNEVYHKQMKCPCGGKLKKEDFVIEKWEFESMDDLDMWVEHKMRTYKAHYYVTDIQDYFKFYDTFQWENLISEY